MHSARLSKLKIQSILLLLGITFSLLQCAAEPHRYSKTADYYSSLSCENCVYGVLLDYQVAPKPKLIIWVEDDLLDSYWRGHNIEMFLDKPLDKSMLPNCALPDMRRKSYVFSFTESCGYAVNDGNLLSKIKTLSIDATNVEAPYSYQHFDTEQVKALKAKLVRQKQQLLDRTSEHIKSVWTVDRLRQYCVPLTRGINELSTHRPGQDEQELYIPVAQQHLYPKDKSKLKLMTWTAIVSKGKIKYYELKLWDKRDLWVIRQKIDDEPLTDDAFLSRRIRLTFDNLLANHLTVNPSSKLELPAGVDPQIIKDKSGKPIGLTYNDNGNIYGALDQSLQIENLYLHGKVDSNWQQILANADTDYKRQQIYQQKVRQELIKSFGPLMLIIDNPWIYICCAIFPPGAFACLNFFHTRQIALKWIKIDRVNRSALPILTSATGLILATALCYLKEQRINVDLMIYVDRNCFLFIVCWNVLLLYLSFISPAMADETYKLDQLASRTKGLQMLRQYLLLCCKVLLLATAITIILAFIWSKIAPRPWSG